MSRKVVKVVISSKPWKSIEIRAGFFKNDGFDGKGALFLKKVSRKCFTSLYVFCHFLPERQ